MHKNIFAVIQRYLADGMVLWQLSAVAPIYAQRLLPLPVDTVATRQLPDVEVVTQARPSVTRQVVPVQIIDRQSIQRLGIQELSDAVRRFSGVTIKDYGGIGGLKTVSIRSLGAHHTAVSYDGVPVADAQSGQVDVSRFTLDNVAMVTLSMGQPDNIFRPARVYASAGTLDIQTQKPVFRAGIKKQLLLKIKSGSFGWLNPILTYSRQFGSRWSASLQGDYMHADGDYPFTLTNGAIKSREKRINSDIKALRAEANVYGEFGRGGSLETKLYTFHSERGLPGAVHFYNNATMERLWNDNSFIQTGYRNQLNSRFAIRATSKYSYSYSRYKEINDKYAAGYQEDRNTQREYYTSAGVLYTPKGSLSMSLVADYAHTTLNNNFLNAAQPRRNTLLTALAAQYKSSRITATGSLLGARIADEVQTSERPPVRQRLSPAIAFSWQPLIEYNWRIRASFKDIYRTPTFTDLYYLRTGNTGLKPERAQQYNAGMTWSGSFGTFFKYASMSIDCYRNQVKDKIVALPTLYIWRMMNLGEVEIKGADVNVTAEMRLWPQIHLIVSGNYTWQRAIDITNSQAKNYKHQIPYTPRHTGNGSIAIETSRLNVAWLLTAVGERYALPQNTSANRINAYVEQSLSAGRTFIINTKRTKDVSATNKGATLRIQGELLNITNAQYDVIQYYPMPGRSWRISLILNL